MFEDIFTAFLLIFILWVLFSYHKTSERRAKAINMSLFSINSIKEFIQNLDLLNIFGQIHLAGWNRFLYGDPYVSLEKVIIDGKPEYYIALPKKYEYILEKDPCVSKIDENNIPEGKDYSAVYLHRKQPRINFGDLKLHNEEGVVLQILARHSHRSGERLETNVRILAWADSPQRANKILNLKKPDRRVIFDFFHRIFENNKRVDLSFGELKNFLIDKFVYPHTKIP